MIDVATGHFSDEASFDTVIQRYEFDKRLRSILFAAIEIPIFFVFLFAGISCSPRKIVADMLSAIGKDYTD